MAKLTPMMQQYHEIKAQYQDYILFFRLGDFYEMFFDDAIAASAALDITLTKRQAGGGEYAPLCGVPYHSADGYLAKLIAKGYKVAICEQVEDPALAKGIVKREVIRLVTPGTITDTATLAADDNNYIACIIAQSGQYGLAYADVTTGQMVVCDYSGQSLAALYDQIRINRFAEIVLSDDLPQDDPLHLKLIAGDMPLSYRNRRFFSERHTTDMVINCYGKHGLAAHGIAEQPLLIAALGGLLSYIFETQKCQLVHFNQLKYQRQFDYLKYFYEERIVRAELGQLLASIYDFERLLGKAVYGSLNPRDALALRQSLAVLPTIKMLLTHCQNELIEQKISQFEGAVELQNLLDQAIADAPPFSVREGDIFKDGYCAELDELRAVKAHGKDWLIDIETEQRAATGIKNLRIGYNKVFGYYVEVSKGNVDKVPEHYQRKQTLANAERYILPQLKEIEDKILGAEERIVKLEYSLFSDIRQAIVNNVATIKQIGDDVAALDCLRSLGQVAQRNNYCQPSFNDQQLIEITAGRHPVVEQIVDDGKFIANDAILDADDNLITIITGPNMAGKSTYLRQIALIVTLAQIGSFVPATRANLCLVDRVFTRVGASDDLFRGQSTFMVEMQELATILRYATADSLILLDEIGRGTATYDGLSIAWSVVEFIAKQLRGKTVFATHYHELTELENVVDGVVNCLIDVRQIGDDIVFLREIKRGRAGRSFGIEVAKLAGVPSAVIARAKQILAELEDSDITKIEVKQARQSQTETRTAVVSTADTELNRKAIIEQLRALDIERITPLDALNALYDLVRQVKQND